MRSGSLPLPATCGVRGSLALLAVVCAAVLLIAARGVIGLEALLRATSACLAAVTLAGTTAAVVLLPRRSALRRCAVAGCLLMAVVVACCGVYLVVPAVLGIAAPGAERLHLRVVRTARRSRILTALGLRARSREGNEDAAPMSVPPDLL
ncbi:hypothetical protein ACFYW8_07920 [Streptomyces sp. NPDC002742]|uniref:hypothetical protein n=1 Tax=Streptomyces sp. NPDC002742 TaxID=3364663 RepID=UPI00368E90E5